MAKKQEAAISEDELFAEFQRKQAELKAKFFAPQVERLAAAKEERALLDAEILKLEGFLLKAEGKKPEAAKPTRATGGQRIRRTAEQIAEDAKKLLADGDAIYAELKKRKSEGPIASRELQTMTPNGNRVTPALATLLLEGKVTRHGTGISTAYSWAK
jgi:hypothetical protein